LAANASYMSSIWWFGGGGGVSGRSREEGKKRLLERNRAAALVFFVIWKDPVTMTAVHKFTLQQVGTTVLKRSG
jgi:hypothetical protein